MEADFKSMKRKELQALCKKHGLPANSTNLKMAESLASLLQKKEDKSEEMKPKGCLKGSGGSSGEDIGREPGVSKKVSFCLEEDKLEFHELQRKADGKYSPEKRKVRRRKSAIDSTPENAAEEAEVLEVPVRNTRSRSLAVAAVGSPGVEKKKGRKRMEAVRQNDEPPQVVKLPSPDKKNKRKAEMEPSRDVPTTRTLRNRVVAVEGDEGLVRDSKPRKAQTKRTAKEKDEASIAPLLQELSKDKEVENDEVLRGKRHPKRVHGAVSVKEANAHNGSEMAPPCEKPPLRRSKRIARHDNSLEEGKRSNSDEITKIIGPKSSRNEALQVSVSVVSKAGKQVAEETEMVPHIKETSKRLRHIVSKGNEEARLGTSLPAFRELNDECVAVAGKILSKKRRNNAPKGRDLTPSVPDGDMLNETAAKKVNREKPCEHKEPPRRLTRSSSVHRILDHETYDVVTVRKNEPVKQERNMRRRRRRRGTVESAAPSSEIETSLQAREVLGLSRRGSHPKEAPRQLRSNASEYRVPGPEISLPVGKNPADDEINKGNKLQKHNKPELEISLPVGGNLVDDITKRERKLQKRQRGQVLGKQCSKVSVPDCKTGVNAESLEDNESSKEPQMRSKHNTAKSDSCSDAVPATIADEKQNCEKHAEIQTVGLQVVEEKISGYTVMEDCSSSFHSATNHEDSNGGNEVAKIADELLSCNYPEVLSPSAVKEVSAVVGAKTPDVPVEVYDVSKMASQVDGSRSQERIIQLSTVVAGSDLEDMLNEQKVCRNENLNCRAAENTMLDAESKPMEFGDVKHCCEIVAEACDPHLSETAADQGEDNSTNFSLLINSGNVGFQSGGESNFEENFKAEIRKPFPNESIPLNVCSDEVRISDGESPKGDSDVMQSGFSNYIMESDSVEQMVNNREVSRSKLVEVTGGIKEIVQEVKEKSKASFNGNLHEKNGELIANKINSFESEELEEALEIGLDKEIYCSKVMEVQSEIFDLLSERPGHSNVEAVVQVESVRDSASQDNFNADNKVAILSFDDGHIYKKEDEGQEVLQVTDLISPASTIVADDNENPVNAFHCDNNNKRNEARGFGGVLLSSTCPEDISIVAGTEFSSQIVHEESEPAKQENIYDASEAGSHIDGHSSVHSICGLDCDGKDSSSLQTVSRIKVRCGGVAMNAMLNGQSDGGGSDVVSFRKVYLLDGTFPLCKDCCQDTETEEHLPENQKDSKTERGSCGAVSSDIYSHKSTPKEYEVLDRFKEDLVDDNQPELCDSCLHKVLPEQRNLELYKVELQDTNETNAYGYAKDDEGADSNENQFAQTVLEERDVVDAGETMDLSYTQKITLDAHKLSADSLTKIIDIDPKRGGLRGEHAVQKARLDVLDGIADGEDELQVSVGNKENTTPSNQFDGEVVHKPVSATSKEMILSPEHLGSVKSSCSEQGLLSYKDNVEGIDDKEASKILMRKFDSSVLEGNEAFKDNDVEEKLDAKLYFINCKEVDGIVSADNVHNNGAGETLNSRTPSIPEYTLEKSERGLHNSGKLPITQRAQEVLSTFNGEVDEASFIMRLLISSKDFITQEDKEISPNGVHNSGKLPIAKRAQEVLSAFKCEVDEASFIMRLLISSKGLITQEDTEISPNDSVDQVGFTKVHCKDDALDEAEPYHINSGERLCFYSMNDEVVLTGLFDLKDHDDDSESGYLNASGFKSDYGCSEEAATNGNQDHVGTSASHLSCKSCKQDKEKVNATSSEGEFSSSSKAPFFSGSSESKSKDAWDAPGAQLIVLEDLFQMESEVPFVMNGNAWSAFCGSRIDEENFEHECKDSTDMMATDDDKASGNREEMEAMPLFSDALVQKEFGGRAETLEKSGGLHASSDVLGCENSYVVGTVSGSICSDPVDRLECQASMLVDGERMSCQEADMIDKNEGHCAADGHEDQESAETLNHVSQLIGGTGVDEKACSSDAIELRNATRETKIQDAAVSRSLPMVKGEPVLESCTESCQMKYQSHFIYEESENTSADVVAGETSITETAVECVLVEESKSKETLSLAENISALPDETDRLNSSDTTVVEHSKYENLEDFGMSSVETVNIGGLCQQDCKFKSQSPMRFSGRTDFYYSPVESGIGRKSDALAFEESSHCSSLDQTEEISCKLLNFRISSAKQASKTVFHYSAPKKMVENLRFHSVIDGSKGKENTPVIKMDRSYKHNVDKSAMSRSSRRPLRSLQKK